MVSHTRTGPELSLPGGVTDIAFSRDGKILLTLGADDAIRLWHWPTGRSIGNSFRGGPNTTHAVFAPDGRIVVKSMLVDEDTFAIDQWPMPRFRPDSDATRRLAKLATDWWLARRPAPASHADEWVKVAAGVPSALAPK